MMEASMSIDKEKVGIVIRVVDAIANLIRAIKTKRKERKDEF